MLSNSASVSSHKYAGSNNIDDVAWYDDNSNSKTHPVGQKQPNELGYDMSGNVWEWCNAWYDKDYYTSISIENSRGPSSGKYRVLRGGSWNSSSTRCRSWERNTYNSRTANYSVNYGFRVARTPGNNTEY